MSEFAKFQARVRASERTIAESDLHFRANRWSEPCEYCGTGPCENCMNTGLKYPTAEDLA